MEQFSRFLGRAVFGLVFLLVVEVLLEEWIVTALDGGWIKTVKSAIYITLLFLTIIKITVDRRWREMTTKADIALVVLGVILLTAGLVGGSPPKLIGEALFVYFRGVIVFYAFRAVRPSWEQVKPLLWATGVFVVVSCGLALWQLVAGVPAYTALGWEELKWAGEGRVHGLLDHPNHLGHVVGLAIAGMVAWFATAEKIAKQWWVLFGVLALVLGFAQSRQSIVATAGAIALVIVLRRANFKRLIAAAVLTAMLSGLPLLFSDSRDELMFRLRGLLNAMGADFDERREECNNDAACEEERSGEVRVLFIKQGVKLWQHQPLLGYGVGQFGGIVAVQHDPNWNMDPRFVEVLGEGGFNMYGFGAISVDVFWLHLLVEAGALGLVAYLVWMCLVALPMARAGWRRDGPDERDGAMYLWAAAAVAFGIIIAAWSPSLEDQLFPPLMFAVVGWGWVLWQRHQRQQRDGVRQVLTDEGRE